jgi:FkbM family methyltransferase
MRRLRKLITMMRRQGCREVLRVLLGRGLDRLNADNNDDPATNGEYALLAAYLRPHMLIVDIGAYRGTWIAQALALQPSLRTYAFEPEPRLFQNLQSLFAGDGRVICINAALAERSGATDLFVFTEGGGSNSLFCRDLGQVLRKETVRIISGDAFVTEYNLGEIDFLKLDVEGAEMRILQGFRETFGRRAIGLCQLEYGATYIDSRTLLRDVFAFADQVGYGVAKLLPRGVRLLEHYDYPLESFKYANYLVYRDANRLPQSFA